MDFEQVMKPLQWDLSNELKYHSGCCAFTAVLTARDGSVLELQFKSLAASSQKPAKIWVCMFASSSTEAYMRIIKIFRANHPTIHVHVIISDYNFKYFGRFQLAMQASTKYVALFDNDQIPGPTTLELLIAATKAYQKQDNKQGNRLAIVGVGDRRSSSCVALQAIKENHLQFVSRDYLQRGHWFVPRELLHAMFSVPFEQIDLQTLSSAAMHMYDAHTFEVCPERDSDEVSIQADQADQADRNSEQTRAQQAHRHLLALQQVAQCSGDTAITCMQTQNPRFPAHPLQSYIAALQSAAQLQCEVSEALSANKLIQLEQQTQDSRLRMALKIGYAYST